MKRTNHIVCRIHAGIRRPFHESLIFGQVLSCKEYPLVWRHQPFPQIKPLAHRT